LAALLFGFGLWTSFHYTVGQYHLNGDTATPLVFWQGVKEHGWRFLTAWSHTSDNWLLSLIPIAFVAFAALGASPEVAIGLGWAIFVACTLLTAWLAARLAGWRVGVAVACVVILANTWAIGQAGMLGHPVTHTISMLWALATLLLAHQAVQTGDRWMAGWTGVLILANTFSDPWALAAIAAPLIVAGAGVWWLHRRTPSGQAAMVVSVSSLAGALGGYTNLFGLAAFLADAHFELAPPAHMLSNAYWALESFAHTFQIIPGVDPDQRAIKLVNLAAFAALLGAALLLAGAAIRRAPPARQLVLVVIVLSVGAVSVPYLAGLYGADIWNGRFFSNLFFFAPLLVAFALSSEAPARWRDRYRVAAVVYGALFALTGAISGPDLWTRRTSAPSPNDNLGLTDFLAGNGLRYGYGTYWGSNANVATLVSGSRVKIRPIAVYPDKVRPRSAGVSQLWFNAGDEPPGDPRRFLILNSDGENCPVMADCVALATRQFGAPSNVLTYGTSTILVWPYPIAERMRD
jgi:hypothetical protein